jgi:phosphatidylserine/phosphatidylglycerophosphate/cardiolipin synthase-like enzyme
MTFLQMIERDLGRRVATMLRWLMCLAAFSMLFHVFILVVLPAYAAEAPSVDVAFSPQRGATDLVVKAIFEAHHSIRMAAYSFTSKPIAEALVEVHRRGIDVEVVLDRSQATERYSSATFLANPGIPVRIDYRYAIMHDKFIVVDDAEVDTGSFNFTAAAEWRNAENTILLKDDPTVAAQYEREWQQLWEESQPIRPTSSR